MSEGQGASQNPTEKAKQDALFEDREPKKIIRIITVTAYMCSVSFVGVVLSGYYIFLWNPPNPRLMHQQVAHAHHEARVDYLDEPPGFTTMNAADPNVFDLFKHASPGADTLKTRREIVKNVNAILSANFEKIKFTETTGSTEAPKISKLNNNIHLSSSSFTSTQPAEYSSTASEAFSSVSPEENEKFNSEASEDSILNDKTTTTESTLTSTQTLPSRRTKRPGIKKPHQTPFALKHLEVPIKLEPIRRRPIRFSSTTMKTDGSNTSDSSEGTLSDNIATAVTASSSDSSEVYENASPRHVAKSLYKILTDPPASGSLRDIDYSSSTDLPQIFPAVPHANNNDDDYHDATIAPLDDIIDD
ncbi:uncharacterized protein LOC131670375 [Phymastichus coffea]|uniref:uncharacterized protein LOC131670375 n=1 Tax=Phymastichus coffea TaxID=108790 RepID=UPI00273A95F7|nr:uncharacterized protein LOC131670375 [Phymastichus coffea]XP_058801906.1 uncharacterized protein LOC131670375 [Phymastichus coffea]XP_058801907.1 uncharacterized protein LOC131670375 [Phymastichus coffea]